MTCFPSATYRSSPARGQNEVTNCVFVTEVSLVLYSQLATLRSSMQGSTAVTTRRIRASQYENPLLIVFSIGIQFCQPQYLILHTLSF